MKIKSLASFSWSRVGFLILLFAIPLYPKFPLLGVRGTYVSVRVVDVVVGLAMGLWLLEVTWRKNLHRYLWREKISRLFLFFWLAGFLANLSAFFITDFINIHLAWLHWLRRVEYMGVFFLALAAISSRKVFYRSMVSLALVVELVFLYGVGQKFFGLPVISTMNAEFSQGILLHLDKWVRISSTFAGHYDLAAWLVMTLPLVLATVLWGKWWQRLLGLMVFLSGFQLLIWTASRVSFVAYLLAITVMLLWQRRGWLWLGLVLFSLAFGLHSRELNTRLAPSVDSLLAMVTRPLRVSLITEKKVPSRKITIPTPAVTKPQIQPSLPPQTPAAGSSAKHRVIIREVRTWPKPEEVAAAARRSSTIRFRVEWPRAERAWLKNPLLGLGYSSLGLATDCDYLRLLGETGLLGFLAFLLIPWRLFNHFWQGYQRADRRVKIFLAAFLGSLVGLLANAVFIDVFEASKDAFMFWLLMGVGYRLAGGFKDEA